VNTAKKTFKREYSAVLMAALLYIIWQDNVAMAEVIAWPVLSFVAASAGLHIIQRDPNNARE
jgi:hypothetical protein